MKKKTKKQLAEAFRRRSKASKKGAKKRIRVNGRFISKKVADDLLAFSKTAKMPIKDYIKKNLEDIKFFLQFKSVTTNYRTDELITFLNTHTGKIETIGYDFKSKAKLFSDLQDFKKNLLNRKNIFVADFYWSVELKLKGRTVIINLSDIENIKKTDSEDLETIACDSITLIISSKKVRKEVRKRQLKKRKDAEAKSSRLKKKNNKS